MDGTNWTSLVSSSTVVGLATHTFGTPVDLRYARVTVTFNSAGSYAHISGMSLYNSDTSTTVEETGNLQQVGSGAGDLSGNT